MITRIRCDKCSHDFPISMIKSRSRVLDRDAKVTEHFFRCPNCDKKYITYLSDPEVEELIRQGKRSEAKERDTMLREIYEDQIKKNA